MDNKIIYIVLSLMVVALAVIVYIQMRPSNPEEKLIQGQSVTNTKLQVCPESWYDNQMPSVGPRASESQYFILDGDRRELDEFDTDWVENNCNLTKQEVY